MSDKLFKRLLLSGFTAILVFAPLARGAVRIWSITPILLIATVMTFSWLWKLNNKKGLFSGDYRFTVQDKLIVSFVLLAVFSSFFSIYKYASFEALSRILCYVALYYLVAKNYGRRFRRYILGLVICLGTAMSAYGLLQYFNALPHSWWRPSSFLAGTYVNHNHFSGYLELSIPVAIGLFFRYRRSKPALRLALGEAIIIMGAAFVFAQSRAAWICMAVSLIIMNLILIKRKFLKRKSLFIVLVTVGLLFSLAYFNKGAVSERIDSLRGLTKGEASVETRIKIWRGTARIIRSNPLIGTGIGTFEWEFARHRLKGVNVRVRYAHNDYLHMASEMGVLALFIMLWLVVIVIKAGMKLSSHPVMLGCAIGMLSLSLHSIVDFNFHIPANMILFVIYAGIITGEARNKEA